MIDDKKIEKAANLHRFELIASRHGSTLGTPMQCFEEEIDAEIDLIEDSFITGAKWMQEEFLKNLWHPASEVPRNDYTDILIVCKEPQRPIVLNLEDILDESADDFASYNDMWMHLCDVYKITKYCYIGDLFPKKGGEQ